MQWLVATPAQRAANGVDLVDTKRLVMLAQLVYVVGRLHKRGWVFGDLSFTNAVFAVNPPRMMLIDCDGAAASRPPPRSGAHARLWYRPSARRGFDEQDTMTDAYKLGLAILRCLSPGTGAGP